MITINDYGVKLVQLTEDKIELVRKWRNSDKIRNYMEYRDHITPEMQKKWFDKISSTTNDFFFLITIEDKEVGLVNIKNVDWYQRVGEWGVFLWDDSYLYIGCSYRAALCLYDFVFKVLHLDRLVAHIINSNKRSIIYHKRLGYTLINDEEIESGQEVNQLYVLTNESYNKHKSDVMELIKKKTILPPPRRPFVGVDPFIIKENIQPVKYITKELAA